MADLIELYEKARLLNLQNLAHGKIDLKRETVSNIDNLDYILSAELELRGQAAIKRNRNASRLPQREFDPSRLKPGIAWQVEQLESMQWIEDEQNIVVIGKCDTGKTTLAAHIGQMALDRRETVYYCNIEEFLRVIKNKDSSRKTEKIYRYMLDCSVIVIDDVMYANITSENLPVFYRAVSFLNEARSLIIITNRELSGWVSAAEDTHPMQTLVDRITANSHTSGLTERRTP
jgi:istB domain protein ATP-binding protein